MESPGNGKRFNPSLSRVSCQATSFDAKSLKNALAWRKGWQKQKTYLYLGGLPIIEPPIGISRQLRPLRVCPSGCGRRSNKHPGCSQPLGAEISLSELTGTRNPLDICFQKV